MTARLLNFADEAHARGAYVHPLHPDVPLAGVTTVISRGVPKHLENWFKKLTAEYAVDNRQAWESLERDAAVDLIKRESDRKRDSAANRGTVVHRVMECHAHGVAPDVTLDESNKGYVDAGLKFLAEWQPEFLWAEATVFNLEHRYAGTLDGIVRLPDGRIFIIDWKTSKGVYAETGLQLAAYRYAGHALDPQHQLVPVPEVDGGAVVHLRPNGTYAVHQLACGVDMYDAFLDAAGVCRFRDRKDVVSHPLPTPQRFDRAAQLRQRAETIKANPAAAAALIDAWPVGVPGLNAGGHTYGQLEQLADVFGRVEADYGLAFPEAGPIGPRDDSFVNKADPRIADLVARMKALPADLLDELCEWAAENGVPTITTGRATGHQIDILTVQLMVAERTAVERDEYVARLLDAASVGQDYFLGALNVADWRGLTNRQIDDLEALSASVDDRVLGIVIYTGGPDGPGISGCGLKATDPDALVARYGTKAALLTAARELGAKPRSAADVLADPVLVARLAAT